MHKATIAIDLDDVLALHAAAFVQFSNERYGTNLQPEEYDDVWVNLWGEMEWAEVLRRAAEFHTSERTLAYAKIEEAGAVLAHLKQRFRLVIVTARPKHLIETTHQWLAQHHADVFDEVHFVPIWEATNTITKADICKQIGANYLIDDSVKHCNIAAEGGITSLLFGTYRWNRDNIDPRVTEVGNWQAVKEFFDGVS
ncbi:MAG: hypothetical protein JWN82_297 [Candidatus Saccharibacteria bacterium]|nr:hypothetical protein [Candidatus Saccharibacteria bacterium]